MEEKGCEDGEGGGGQSYEVSEEEGKGRGGVVTGREEDREKGRTGRRGSHVGKDGAEGWKQMNQGGEKGKQTDERRGSRI